MKQREWWYVFKVNLNTGAQRFNEGKEQKRPLFCTGLNGRLRTIIIDPSRRAGTVVMGMYAGTTYPSRSTVSCCIPLVPMLRNRLYCPEVSASRHLLMQKANSPKIAECSASYMYNISNRAVVARGSVSLSSGTRKRCSCSPCKVGNPKILQDSPRTEVSAAEKRQRRQKVKTRTKTRYSTRIEARDSKSISQHGLGSRDEHARARCQTLSTE